MTTTRAPRAFTLIELLVVVTIIGILAAILLPFLGDAKDKAIEATSKALIKNLELALKSYQQRFSDLPGFSASGANAPVDDISQCVEFLVPLGYLDEVSLKNFGIAPPVSGVQGQQQVWDNPTSRTDLRNKVTGGTTRVFLLDDWGNAMHYVEYGSRTSSTQLTAPTLETNISFDTPDQDHVAQNINFVDIWSNGPNRANNSGLRTEDKNDTADDVNNWN